MKLKIKDIILLIFGILISSCSDEIMESTTQDIDSSNLVEFNFEAPGDFLGVRSQEGGVSNPKTSFIPGDIIHVEARFYDKEGTELNIEYQSFEMNSAGGWTQRASKKIYWPNDAKKGKFQAIFVKKFDAHLEKTTAVQKLYLSEIGDDTDPLYAQEEYEWGHKVNLKFKHLCTHLTITGLEPDISDYFWLVGKKSTTDVETMTEGGLKNVFTLSLNNDNTLNFGFISEGDENFKKLVYVQRKSENTFTDDIKTGSKVKFFLAPGNYSEIELRTINNYEYLSFTSDELSNLEANIPYEVNIQHSKGVTYVEEEDTWDDDDTTEVDIFNPNEFLEHLVSGDDYYVEDDGEMKKILQKTVNGSLLLRNISFNGASFNAIDIPSGFLFDGGNHYISDLSSNLFNFNHGTIRHLGIKDVRCDNVVLELISGSTGVAEKIQWGSLCRLNEGTIDKVRLKDVYVKFSIGQGASESNSVFNIGTLTGKSTGTISDITYSGSIKIESEEEEAVEAIVIIGGFIGQLTGVIQGLSPAQDDEDNTGIEVLNKMSGNLSEFYVGAAIGEATQSIKEVSLPNVIVDSSTARGLIGQTGGLVGRLRATAGVPSELVSCTVAGTVRGLPVYSYQTYPAESYTGGLAGYINNYNVTDCRTLCNVAMAENGNNDELITYATGGGFGRIIYSDKISRNYILGSTLTGPQKYIGNFAGIVPGDKTWDDYLSAGNIVNQHVANNIGASIEDKTND